MWGRQDEILWWDGGSHSSWKSRLNTYSVGKAIDKSHRQCLKTREEIEVARMEGGGCEVLGKRLS